mmetsp:Transcript_41753/g.37179  ORF Transcript_41753/g.37179 Transcript_41753/m.37179 type:complete len:82 (+) Transcript_41753:1171-1416(+)|eukprot:CAMPEP_0114575922 /NCGR_PEP_ID=MMETSP0125-20121206/736_1 /TAXON_ID=485358 ORGANISM="Aristerostoma sp., Strain ATCC 50986" /NCGR_SAMPLE_ID=MMETSP0125 /ASSEMBLY_ACC=CAM_ASM_000245 /LENGTH=81 /DNA_ID=CAMNT_0001764025 /DNA_START=1149 /DNA_END=1394 /DNA_ORIENTATION=+
MNMIQSLDSIVSDIVKNLNKTIDESKQVTKNELEFEFNLEKTLKIEVLRLYADLRNWVREVKENLVGVSEFYVELNRKFNN